MKKLLSMVLALGMIASINPSVFALSTENVTIIKNEIEISEILKEKGLYDESEEVLAVIEIDKSTPEVSSTPSPHRGIFTKDIYVEIDGAYSRTEYSAKFTHNLPPGSFDLELPFSSGRILNDNLGLKVELFESALGYELNDSTTDKFSYDSEHYSYPFTVKGHINYDGEYYKVYDKDLIFDDYIGQISVERETGYTIKVVKQQVE
ncbi:MAG: hypothetical protein ATN31_02170 [Candidatus Epulonipiscioides saccharophilum]|nr:MAG: hypothetical protein ATN31_02170 [Epulopiscium sp. AS2M-Bin001]